MDRSLQLEPGSLLVDRYHIVKRIGGGGMGSVYLARDKRLAESSRAVKEMIGMYTDEAQRKKVVEDFERESQLLASLDHPAIPTIYDYFTHDGCYYLVMKYVSGGDLSDRLKKVPNGILEERVVVEWGIQIADVLDYLHTQKPPIIYRDMKPANIMLDEKDRIVLVDFGIARFVASTQKNVTAIGTMGYAPPELFAGKVEPRSDIYSLGATLFHLLTGRDPQDNPLLMFDFSRNPRPRQINPKITEGMDAILVKAVDHKPANRFSSAGEMRQALEDHLKVLNGEVKRVSVPDGPVEINFCGQCGNKLVPGNLFCQGCGAPQKEGQAQAPLNAFLVFLGPKNQAISFLISKDLNSIGRLDTNRGILPDIDLTPFDREGKVSRRHAVIHREGNNIMVEDLGSTNGTYMNRKPERLQPKQRYSLNSGDEICVGETILKFFLGSIPANLSVSPIQKLAPGIPPTSNEPVYTQKSLVGDIAQIKSVMTAPPPPPPPSSLSKASVGEGITPSQPPPKAVGNPVSRPTITINAPPNFDSISKISQTLRESRRLEGPMELQLSTNVIFDKEVSLGRIAQLQVGLVMNNGSDARAHPYDKAITIKVPNPSDINNIVMEVYVAAPGFEIEPDIFARFTLPAHQNMTPRLFQLKAVQPGTTVVTIDFYQDSDYLTSVSVETNIV